MQGLHQSEDGVGGLAGAMKSERQDWPDEDQEEDYPEDNITSGNGKY